jgi:uncharacterized membrane protein YqhA
MKECSGCALKRPKRKNIVERSLGWSVKAILIAIVMLAAYEQFVKPMLADNNAPKAQPALTVSVR